ncbi:ABC transporter substrate-binding protein [Pseudoalteromonas sp. HL-AS1]|uniref:ABC transporter substrate-binding protein n=1 Tax=Pseudoalteromonas sp. HL-AS1 TaxID=3071081 RepID=UPI0028150175|nr:ABC transporter substrate-binding protein [Pseudoalteromonas sp. HL-AS1]WMS91540.1 ABC transporter substrate-binding protein [Pseudoalteromonas sp. HL-AS1]
MLKNGYYAFCLLIVFNAHAVEQKVQPLEEIIWLQSYTPPFHIAKSESAPQGGICDNLTEQLIRTITDVKHTRLIVPQQRINKYLNEGKNVCFPCVIYKKNNNQQLNYSNPTTVYPPFSIITTKELKPQLEEKHGSPIHLINLLTDPQYVYGQAAARKFTTKINTIIENTKRDKESSLSWNSENESQAVIARLSHGFLDYSIDYPFMADYFNKQGEYTYIESVPIAENDIQFIRGAIGCAAKAPNNFAEQALKKINRALKNNVLQSPEYQQSQHNWLKTTFTDFDKHYQQQVINFYLLATDAQANTDH